MSRSVRLVVGLLMALTALLSGGAVSASAHQDGARVRVSHMAPGVGPVDVYVNGGEVLAGVPYGATSGYLNVPEGRYRFAVRLAGAPATSAPLLSTSARLEGGESYTVTARFRNGNPALVTTRDRQSQEDLARVRVSHSAKGVGPVDVYVNGSRVLAGVPYGATSGYLSVPEGRYSFAVRLAGAPATSAPLLSTSARLEGGESYTVTARFVGGAPALVTSIDRGHDSGE